MAKHPVWQAAPAFLLLWAAGSVTAGPRILGLSEALDLAERTAPSIEASRAREEQAIQSGRRVEAAWYPTLDAAAVDSSGFAGSASGLDGFSGLVASPYRKGPGFDAFARWDLVDLSTWYAARSARIQAEAAHQDTLVRREAVDQRALGAYLEAVADQGKRDAWSDLAGELSGVAVTVRTFVRNGQYAQVQQILIEDQLQDAKVQAQAYAERYQADLQGLGYLTGLDGGSIASPGPEALADSAVDAIPVPSVNPLVSAADLRAEASAQLLAGSRAQSLPKIELAGSAGDLQGTRLVQDQDYSLYAGVTLPLFEGFRLDADERRAAAQRDEARAQAAQARLDVETLAVRFRQRSQESLELMQALLPQRRRAARAVREARQRYLSFLGPLADLQQALKDLVSVSTRFADAKAEHLLAEGSLRLVGSGL